MYLCFKVILVNGGHLRNHLQRQSTCLAPCTPLLVEAGNWFIFSQNLDLYSDSWAKHKILSHRYIPLDVLNNVEGSTVPGTRSNGIFGSGPFWSARRHGAKILLPRQLK
jgi:hypothetical protein